MTTREVNCPTCGTPVAWELANRHRPFCSERCRLIDLGAWASESYRIPAESQQEDTSADIPDSIGND